jgi:predicted deacylase
MPESRTTHNPALKARDETTTHRLLLVMAGLVAFAVPAMDGGRLIEAGRAAAERVLGRDEPLVFPSGASFGPVSGESAGEFVGPLPLEQSFETAQPDAEPHTVVGLADDLDSLRAPDDALAEISRRSEGVGAPQQALVPVLGDSIVLDAPDTGVGAEATGQMEVAIEVEAALRTPSDGQPDMEQPAAETGTRSLRMLGGVVPPGSKATLYWRLGDTFLASGDAVPVLVVNGTSPGPVLCLTSAIHGDELNGIEIVRRVIHDLDPDELSGALVGVPIVNIQGFQRGTRYLPDRRDLNRYFPGRPDGSAAARTAHSFFENVVRHCDRLVDLHTGSFHRSNLTQVRGDLTNPDVVALTQGFGATVVLHHPGTPGTLRRAATDAGIPSVTLETGEPLRLQGKHVKEGVKGIEALLDALEMQPKLHFWGDPEPAYYDSKWVRADAAGILLTRVKLGSSIEAGDVLGSIADPVSNQTTDIHAPVTGRIIGMSVDQVVLPGFAAFHIGIEAEDAAEASGGSSQEAAPVPRTGPVDVALMGTVTPETQPPPGEPRSGAPSGEAGEPVD